MASFLNINSNLTAAHAREVGAGASFSEATYFLAGHPPRPVSMGLKEVVDEETGEKMWVRSRLGSLLDHEEITADVVAHEKAALLAKKAGGAIVTGMKNNQGKDLASREKDNLKRAAEGLAPIDPEGGAPYEWDHWILTLSPDETAWLKANPDREADFQRIVSEGMRRHSEVPGERQALITPVHKDTGDWHIQGLVSRFALDVSGPKPIVPAAVEVSTSSHMSKLVARMQADFDAAGMPIAINKANLGLTKPRGLFESKGTSDAVKEAYGEAVTGAGGVPGARTTVGPIPAPQASATAIETLTPEIATLERGKALATDDGLAMSRRLQQLKADMEATEAAMQAAANREATFDAAIAAIGQKTAAESSQAKAEANAIQEAHLRTLAEQEAASAVAKAVEAQRLATEAREHADALAAELRKAGELAADEPIRIKEAEALAVAPVQDRLNEVTRERDQLSKWADDETARADALEVELAEEKRTFVDRARKWASENVTGPIIARAEAAEAALKTATAMIDAFPDKMEAELTRRLDAMEARMESAFNRLMKAAEDRYDATIRSKDELIDSLRAAAAAPLRRAADKVEGAQRTRDADEPDAPAPDAPPKPPRGGGGGGGEQGGGGSAPAAPAAPAAPVASATPATGRAAPHYQTPPAKLVEGSSEWKAAEKSLADNQAKGKAEGMTVREFHEAMHEKWLAAQEAKAAVAQDRDGPDETRKPK